MDNNPVEGLLSSLNDLPGFAGKVGDDINEILELLSGKACGDLNSAIDEITSLTNTNQLLNNILDDTRGIFTSLEKITGITDGQASENSQCFDAVSKQVSQQMNSLWGGSPTKRRLLLLGTADNTSGTF